MFRRFFSRRFAEASNYYRAGPRESVESRAQRFGTYSFFRNKRVRRFVIASPFLLYLIAWECVVWRRRRFYVKQRKNFTGNTPFYGKAWGMETDYLLELALSDGDLIVVCYDPEALHWPHAMMFYLKTLLLGRAVGEGWNRIGIVCRKGANCLVNFAEGAELYGEVLADYRVSYVAVRKLQCSDEIREKLPVAIREVREEQLKNALPYSDVFKRWHEMWHRRGGPDSLGDDPVVKQISKELEKSHKRHDLKEMLNEMQEVVERLLVSGLALNLENVVLGCWLKIV